MKLLCGLRNPPNYFALTYEECNIDEIADVVEIVEIKEVSKHYE